MLCYFVADIWLCYKEEEGVLGKEQERLQFLSNVCVCLCTLGIQGFQNRASNLLELELQEIESYPAWVLGTKVQLLVSKSY